MNISDANELIEKHGWQKVMDHARSLVEVNKHLPGTPITTQDSARAANLIRLLTPLAGIECSYVGDKCNSSKCPGCNGPEAIDILSIYADAVKLSIGDDWLQHFRKPIKGEDGRMHARWRVMERARYFPRVVKVEAAGMKHPTWVGESKIACGKKCPPLPEVPEAT
jgi:hypothetical protein